MNKYISKIFGVMFQSQQPQHSPTSPEEWSQHWQSQGQPWRSEPAINAKRQEELSKCRAIIPDIEKGIYPFKGMKLSRADVEWLLATHEDGRGPVDWNDESQRKREGLELRGADLHESDLKNLPLANLRAGLAWVNSPTVEQVTMAAVHLEGAILRGAHFEGAILGGAHFERADLAYAHLEEADLVGVHLEEANLYWAHLDGTDLGYAHLGGAYLRGAFFDRSTDLDRAELSDEKHGSFSVVDLHWGDVNLGIVRWNQVKVLGDEYEAHRRKTIDGKKKEKDVQLRDYRRAIRANHQLAVALQAQGHNEEATHFAFRAQVLQRKVFWKQLNVGKWFFSMLLALLAGYGYRMWRIFAAYLIVVSVCALAYFVLGLYFPPHLSLMQAFLESVTAFHGRVFLEVFSSETPQIWVTAAEAVLGLLIEGVFIAMLTQRFFGK